ncbi:MAG: hypothetical protein EHM18_18210 [Acidobacteria bacterium]|nr:MAG: hypothetical protein EHM18_18210 [Acidobacteriota bacterium]
MHAPLQFLADMNISPVTAEEPRAGWDIVRVSERLDPRASDEEILSFAPSQLESRYQPRSRFLVCPRSSRHDSPSLITLRLTSADPLFTAVRLKEAVQASEPILAEGCVVTVDDQTVRVRELPIG